MYKLYLKIAVRYLFKNKLYSFINIGGLAIGIASFALIMLYVNYEKSYDTFSGSENVYRIYMDYMKGDTFEPGDAQTYNLTGPTFKKEFPEVLDFVRFYRLEETTFKKGENILKVNSGALADNSYFDIFNKTLIRGTVSNALSEPNTIVLTETIARKFFGKEDPIGKTFQIYWGTPTLATVTGVMKDIPKNTHFKISYLLSFPTIQTWDEFKGQQKPDWSRNNYFTYLKLDPKANIGLLQQKVIESDFEDDKDERHNIEPLQNIHLYSDKPYEAEANGSIMRIRFLIAIAFIILMLSWLNYINLSTTKSLERAKEIAIRKVAGAKKRQVLTQAFLESVILNMVALVIAIVIVLSVLPFYRNFINKELTFTLQDTWGLAPLLGVVLTGTLLAGLYPAFLLSNFTPAKALKGKLKTSSRGLQVRKGLIITQFVATIILLIGTIVVTKQINFMQEQPIGSELSNVLAIKGEILNEKEDSLRIGEFQTLFIEIQKIPAVDLVTTSETYPGDGYDNLSSFVGIQYPDGTQEDKKVFYTYTVQPDYFKALGIDFLTGNTFLKNNEYKSKEDIIINEKFAKEIGIFNTSQAVGQNVKFWGHTWNIIGVIEDYHHFGVKTAVQPLMLRYDTTRNNLIVKLKKNIVSTTGYNEVIQELKSKWEAIFPESTFGFTFIDQKFQAQYDEDKRFNQAFQFFTMLAILIAALGLFGLTSYTCLQRKKEIGVRKVNGASVGQILSLLNIGFIKWIGVAFVIAVPIAWYAMNNWLQSFALKTNISWWIFLVAGGAALIITLLTVSWQSFQAATTNPVEALRDE